VDRYLGVQQGHELFDGTLTTLVSSTQSKLVTNKNVQVMVDVVSATEKAGLPSELPLKAGETVELQGVYIPAGKANLKNANGPAAVVRLTHAPCGYAVIGGQRFQ